MAGLLERIRSQNEALLKGKIIEAVPYQPLEQDSVKSVFEHTNEFKAALPFVCTDCAHLRDFPTDQPEYVGPHSFRWCERIKQGRFPMQRICEAFALKTDQIIH